MVTCRLLVELQQFKDAIKVLDTIVSENDEMPEAWYLLAFSYFNLKKFQNAHECCKNVKTMIIKLKMTPEESQELRTGQEELLGAILKALGKSGAAHHSDDDMKDGAEGEDDGFETVSEEDISGDEEDAEMKE
jgi:predicted Zn-dependent protease